MSADSWTANFNGGVDPNLQLTSTAPGFSSAVDNGQLILTKDEGVTYGYYFLSTSFDVIGDFTASVDVSAPSRHDGMSFGLGFGQGGAIYQTGGDIYFAGARDASQYVDSNLLGNGFNVSDASLSGTFEIARAGNQVTLSYSTSGTFTSTITEASASLTAPVNVSVLLAEEGNSSDASTANFSNFKITSAGGFQPLPKLAIIQTKQTPTTTLTVAPPTTNLGQLQIYNPSTGTFVAGTINPNLPTIVLTHGYREDPSSWASGMAGLINQYVQQPPGGIQANQVNLIAWNWGNYAQNGDPFTLSGLITATDSVPLEGQALAQQLSTALGVSYQLPIHFIGHSLGTMVNAEAIDTFHQLDSSESSIQDTLFDPAEIASAAGAASPVVVSSPLAWASPIPSVPIQSIDNYVSTVGSLYPNAVNVILTQGPTPLNPFAFHDYPEQWYDETIGSQVDDAMMGFRYDITQPNGLAGEPAAGIYPYNFVQTGGGELTLQPISYTDASLQYGTAYDRFTDAVAHATLNTVGSLAVDGITGAIQAVGNVTANIITGPAGGLVNQTTPQFILPKEPGQTSSLSMSGSADLALANPADASQPTSSSYLWVLISIPANAQLISLDFTFQGLSPDDYLTVGINDTLLFEIEDQFITEGVATNTGLLDVSQWSGQDVTLFLGLNAADDNNAGGTITIDDILFQRESLLGDANGDGSVDVADLAILNQNLGQMVTGGYADGDFNGDGIVNADDFSLYMEGLAEYQASLATVPEPGVAAMILVSGLFLTSRRRRN